MERAMWRKKLDPARIEEYVRAHAEPWPELIDEIKARGISNYSIFLDGDEVFGYFEHEDLASLDTNDRTPAEITRRWQAKMRPLSADKDSEDQGLQQLRNQVFFCD